MSDRVTIDVQGGVADVRLSRPDKLNALDGAMFQALVDAGDQVAADKRVRAVVLSGEGRGFCAGLDLGSFAAMADPAAKTSATEAAPGSDGDGVTGRMPGRITNLFQQAVYTWTEQAVPVIAAVHGVAFGGGIQLALGADIRIVHPEARMSVMEIRWGLLPDMTGPQVLPRIVGLDVAKELVFTGRQVSGTEAAQIGLATRVSDTPREDALALAAQIAARNPQAIRGAKALLDAAGTRPLAESFLEESRLMGGLIGSPNQVEAVMAEMEKRAPTFTDD
jgi:enoyl-CoA hydratase/carnithine racemase